MRTLLCTVALLLMETLSYAQNPLKADPEHYKVEFENSQVRAVRVLFGPHYKSIMNETQPRVVVVLTDENFSVSYPDGKSEDRHLKAGPSSWSAGGTGIPENLSDQPFELIWLVAKVAPEHQSEAS